MTAVAADYVYRDGNDIHRVIQRLREEANADQTAARRWKNLVAKGQVSRASPRPRVKHFLQCVHQLVC